MEEILRKFWEAGVDHEATLDKKYSFEQTLSDNAQALQLLQTDVIKSVCVDDVDNYQDCKLPKGSCELCKW